MIAVPWIDQNTAKMSIKAAKMLKGAERFEPVKW